MNKVVRLLLQCVGLAVVKAILVGLAATLLLVLAYAYATRPRETLLFVGALTLFVLASARPLASIIGLAAVGVAVVLVGAKLNREGSCS